MAVSPPREPPVVAFDAATCCYRTGNTVVVALRNATAALPPGARVALVGPSGSGKTTLLNLAASLEDPTTGHVSWPALGDRGSLRPLKVGIAFQGPSLLPPLNVEDNVSLPLLLAGLDETESRARAVRCLTELGLAALAGRFPDELSGGEAQRVGMARALVVSPRLLLADEPTGQLDGPTASAFLDRVFALLPAGAGALVATHDRRIARRLPVQWQLAHGTLIASGKSAPEGPAAP